MTTERTRRMTMTRERVVSASLIRDSRRLLITRPSKRMKIKRTKKTLERERIEVLLPVKHWLTSNSYLVTHWQSSPSIRQAAVAVVRSRSLRATTLSSRLR